MRFWNNDILSNIDGVLSLIETAIKDAPHPNPLPANGERE